jgi:hypothetical protein
VCRRPYAICSSENRAFRIAASVVRAAAKLIERLRHELQTAEELQEPADAGVRGDNSDRRVDRS